MVDLGLGDNQSFFYPETNIRKADNLNLCYRTPRLLLMTAHAINMGLLRVGGALPGVSNQEEWRKLGYSVVGDFTDASVKEQKTVKIERRLDKSPHPIDQDDFEAREAIGELLTLATFSNESEEQKWIAQQVAKDLPQGLDPSDIMITALFGDREKNYFQELQTALEKQGVKSCIAGVDSNKSEFSKPGYVTIANIYRAKGNEAFVALTRARVWCVATGIENRIFEELRTAKEQFPYSIFPAFNKNSLKRVIDEEI